MEDGTLHNETLHERLYRRRHKRTPPTRFSHVLAHSLTSVIVAFFLTGVVGWGLSTCYAQRQADAAARNARYEANYKAIQDISHLIYYRYARAEMLKSSIVRQAPNDELRQRKRDYDEALVEWITNLDSTLLLMRRVSGDQRYGALQTLVADELTERLDRIDQCLTDAYDARIAGDITPTPDLLRRIGECKNLDDNLERVLTLNGHIVDDLSALARK
jgi:hypothetical protein